MCHSPDIFPDWGKIITAGVDNVKLIDAAVQFFYKFRSAFFAPFRFQFIQVKGRITGKFELAVSKENAFVISFQRGERVAGKKNIQAVPCPWNHNFRRSCCESYCTAAAS